MNDLKNKNIIVTGASGGIGNSIVEKLYECGASVLASGTKIEKLEVLKKKFEKIKILKFDIKNNELPLWTDIICENRNKLYNYLRNNNIICRKFWFPLSKKNFYSHQRHSSFKNTNKIENKIMWLPSSFLMKKQDQLRVIKKIKIFYKIN